jgi:hypothetical protein
MAGAEHRQGQRQGSTEGAEEGSAVRRVGQIHWGRAWHQHSERERARERACAQEGEGCIPMAVRGHKRLWVGRNLEPDSAAIAVAAAHLCQR